MSDRPALPLLLAAALAGACAKKHEKPDAGEPDAGEPDAGPECEHPAEPVACEGVPRAESGMFEKEVCVPGGWFLMGSDENPEHDQDPAHWVLLSPFFMDKYPVTIERYQRCIDAGVCPVPGPPSPEWPPEEYDPRSAAEWMSGVGGEAFCAWDARGGEPASLPTEAQLERAAVGLGCSQRRFPWGEEVPSLDVEPWKVEPWKWTCDLACNVRTGSSDDSVSCNWPDGYCLALPGGETPDGVAALAGTVSFATRDCYVEDYYSQPEAGGPDPVCDGSSAVDECAICASGRRVWRGQVAFELFWDRDARAWDTGYSPHGRGHWPWSAGGGYYLGLRCVRPAP